MKIGLDTRMINSSGIGTTIRGLLDNWSADQRKQVIGIGTDVPAPYAVYGFKQHWGLGRMLNAQDLTLYHMPHYDVPLSYSGPLVVTVHDLIHYLFPQYSTKPFTRVYSKFMLGHVAKRAAKVIVVSENTKKDFVSLFPSAVDKVVVINPAVDESFKPLAPAAIKDKLTSYNLAPGYLLYVGNLREGKNTRGLVKAYIEARKSADLPPLVLVGKNSLKNFDPRNLGNNIRHLDEVPYPHLQALYSGASMFVFPSFYEGFGLPPLEAMACGTPVIVSRSGSLAEVCGNAAEFVDPHSTESIKRVMIEFHQNAALREKRRSEGLEWVKRYSWKKFASETWRVYEDVAKMSKS